MRLSFDSIDEVKEFVKGLKGTRGGKNDDAGEGGNSPEPLKPPVGGQQTAAVSGFLGGGSPGGFPGGGAAIGGADPAVAGVVGRIVTKLDQSLAAGNSADAALTWFRTHFGPEAAQATLDQIKQLHLPRLPLSSLENIAKMMGA